MATPPTSPPSPPPSEIGEISLRRWRRPILPEMMMGEGFRRIGSQFESMARRVVRQELEKRLHNDINPIPRQLVGGAQHARYHLEFQNEICHPLHTCRNIKGKAGSDVEIALFDNDKKVVTSGPLSSIKVEIVVLNGDFNNDDRETWSEEEFNRRIALPRDNKGQLLKGERFIKLNNGIGSVGNIAFTDNSSSRKTKTFRLGVRYAQSAPNGERIQEGITEPFRVKDRRVESSQKHPTPSLNDEVWRLKHIRNGGKFHEKLQGHDIKTVQDLLRYYNMEKGNLRKNLRMAETYWKEIVKHAKECDPGDGLFSYSMREKNTVVPIVLFFNSVYHLVGVKFGDCYTTLDNLDASRQDSVESWKNLAYRNINGMQLDHRMINGHPMPLLLSDVTSFPGSSTLPPHISNSQIRNSAILADQVDSQVGLLQETSVASVDSLNLLMEHPYIDVDNHQPSYATSNLPLEMGNSSFNNISTAAPNSEFPGLPVTHYASEACFRTQPYSLGNELLEQSRTTVKDVSFERDNSLDFTFPMETAPPEDTSYPQSMECLLANYDEQATPVCPQNQVESSPFVESPTAHSTILRMSRLDSISWLDSISCEGPIQTFISNFSTSSGGETSRSVAPLSSPPTWAKLLAPIKWVRFAKKVRARILVRQTLVATV
ncbi:calmodulin-binding protein 60 D-like isoform X2 [Ananas comosus]|uniref:Calmodulin-binding protein 60 D-like isoform X2 n=1 Tax=Ananas comosus TaxID=4615 RepID=A0A6P5GYZ4_ANACO|nr:calmodulin-binding protein 60 D-like isoform X2 [Ananas comosus]